MSRLNPFTALAMTTVQLPYFASHFDWSRPPTAIGFLTYDPGRLDQTGLDLAIRIRTYGERSGLLRRWALLNVPPGLCVGWDIRTRDAAVVSHLQDRRLASLCRGSGVAGLISLKSAARYGQDFVMACNEAGISCDAREPAEKLDDYSTSSYERAAAGIILDTVATFRLALSSALGEMRGGAALHHEIETRLAADLGRLVRRAVSDVPVLSHLLSSRSAVATIMSA